MTAISIPSEMTALPQWVCWKYADRNGKRTKIPVQVDGSPAAVNDPTTWADFDTVSRACESGEFAGCGFVLTAESNITCIDFDRIRCTHTGEISPWAVEIIERMNSFSEVSPSGTGIHVWGVCSPGAVGERCRFGSKHLRAAGFAAGEDESIEIYRRDRYITVTGEHVGEPRPLRDISIEIADLFTRLDPQPALPPVSQPQSALDLPDEDLLERAFNASNGEKFRALWAGDFSGYPSASEADCALAQLLAFWTGGDAGRADSLFRRSGLMRAKWDERRGIETYGIRTIRAAVTSCTEYYTPGRGGTGGILSKPQPTGVSFPPGPPSTPASTPSPPQIPEYRPFPVQCLPALIREFVECTADSIQVAAEWAALPALVAAGCVSGVGAKIKEGYHEPGILWALCLGNPSSAKSPALRAALSSVSKIDTELHRAREAANKEYQRDLDRCNSRDKRGAGERPQKAVVPQIKLTDTTTEAVVRVAADNPKFPVICSDEISGFISSFNAYRGGRGGDLEFWLASYNADAYTVNRASKEPVHVPRLGVGLIGFTTPAAFRGGLRFDQVPNLVSCGFLGRSVLSMPPCEPRTFTQVGVDPDLLHRVEQLFRSLWGHAGAVLELSAGALKLWTDFFNATQARCKSVPEAIEHFEGKQAGRAARIAAILAVLHGDDDIGEGVMRDALTISEWFSYETSRAYAILKISTGTTPPLLKYLLDNPGKTASEINRSGPREFRRKGTGEIEAALKSLESAGLIAAEPVKEGRPAVRWFPAPEPEEPPLLEAEELSAEEIAELRRKHTGSAV